MHLQLTRTVYTTRSTVGQLLVDGRFECHVLEDVVRPATAAKVPGQTAIPAGTYAVTVTYSPRFRQPLPLLISVPGFEGIRIHPGNDAAATSGCLLVGRYDPQRPDWVADSRAAFARLFDKIRTAHAGGRAITLTIA